MDYIYIYLECTAEYYSHIIIFIFYHMLSGEGRGVMKE